MILTRNSIVTLEDNKRYLFLTGETLENITFGLVSTLQSPAELKVVEFLTDNGKIKIDHYKGGDYVYILKRLLDKSLYG